MRSARELGLGTMPPRRGGDFDWDAVDAELQGVSAGFKDPKFDPIAHVLNLLSSGDADHQLAKVVFSRGGQGGVCCCRTAYGPPATCTRTLVAPHHNT